jgi:hypothetical protein
MSLRRVVKTLTLASAFAVAVVFAVQGASARDSAAAKTPKAPLLKVLAVIHGHPRGDVRYPGKIFFSPAVINPGTVVIEIRNLDDDFGRMLINGVSSRIMGPNRGRAVIRVTFKKPGAYTATLPDEETSGIYGVLKVVR